MSVSIEVVNADEPYDALPRLPYGAQLLGWYRLNVEFAEWDGEKIFLSDMCVGEPEIEQVVKVLSHEYLHHILSVQISNWTSIKLDNITDDADFLIDRPENNHVDDRPCKVKYAHDAQSIKYTCD